MQIWKSLDSSQKVDKAKALYFNRGVANMNTKTVAAIDVGSNAIRLMVGRVSSDGVYTPITKLREPVRLGRDAFGQGRITSETAQKTYAAFRRFQDLIEANNVEFVRAVATSAIREASNGEAIVDGIFQRTGIGLEIIDFVEEGRLIHRAVIEKLQPSEEPAILMDIGGGSVEFIISDKRMVQEVVSFKMGTVRTLLSAGQVENCFKINKQIESFRSRLRDFIGNYDKAFRTAIGTGGNIVCLAELRSSLLGKRRSDVLKFTELQSIISELEMLGFEGRLSKLKLRRDRADVIIPAAYTVRMFMEETNSTKLLIPKVGLKEGLMTTFHQ